MAFGLNVANVTINGQSLVWITPQGGSNVPFGYVAEISAEADSIDYETTVGGIPAGHNWKLTWKGVQTRATNLTDSIGTRQLSSVTYAGPTDSLTITTAMAGVAAIFMSTKFVKKFSNKADSFMEETITIPGVAFATSQGFMS